VIIPTYNERENLLDLVEAVWRSAAHSHVLVVDDGSPDGTGQLADQVARRDGRCHVIHREGKLGLGTASIRGLRWAMSQGFDVAVIMDADFSHDPARLPAILDAVKSADVAVGSRYVRGGSTENWPLLRRLTSRAVNLLSRALMGLPLKDVTGAYRAYRLEKIRKINFDNFISKGYSFQEEMAFRCKLAGCRMVEVPITFRNRERGTSKVSPGEMFTSLASLARIAASRSIMRPLS